MDGETLTLDYVPLNQLRQLDGNPKIHDLEKLAEVIRRRGFVDPAKIDTALDGQLVYGNGRAEALAMMRDAGEKPPRGIRVEGGEWLVPVIQGVDSASRAEALALAVEHNLAGAAGVDQAAALFMFDPVALAEVAGEAAPFVFEIGLQGFDVDPSGEGVAPGSDGSPFRNMTFTVTAEQFETIEAALERAIAAEPFGDTGNDNRNGNALARIAESYP